METKTLDLGPQAAEVARIVTGVREEQLTGPTPCAGTPVAGLLDHLAGLALAFRAAARKQPLPGGPRASAEDLPPDWRSLIPARLAELATAWEDAAAWAGVTEVAGARMPAAAMGRVALDEVLVHGWDLAVATGQDYRPDPAAVEACLAYVTAMNTPENQAMRDGQFGPVVPVPDDAPALDRLLGLTGRDPRWGPPGR